MAMSAKHREAISIAQTERWRKIRKAAGGIVTLAKKKTKKK